MKGDELAASNDPAGQSIDYASMFALLQAWDVDGDGLVSSEDFKQGLSSIGFQISAHDADCLCKALDTDGTGNIQIAALAELLEPPAQDISDGGGGSHGGGNGEGTVPAVPGTEATPGTTPSSFHHLAPELRAWEQLAAADPAAAADAIAALPDDQAQALHAALAGAAAMQASGGMVPGVAYGSGDEDGAGDEMDPATLAAARSAQMAMAAAAGGGGGGGEPMPTGESPQASAAPAASGPLKSPPPTRLQPGGLTGGMHPAHQPPPMPAPPMHAMGSPPEITQQQSAGLGDTMTSVGGSSVGVGGGHSSQRAPSLSANQKRRSFGSLATRFSLRNVNTPGANMLSANLLDGVGGDEANRPESARPLPGQMAHLSSFSDQLPTTPAAYPTQGSLGDGMSLPSGGMPSAPQSIAGGASEATSVPRPASRAGSFAQLSRIGSRSSLSVSFERRESLYRPQDVATLPQKLGELLLANHARAIDLFRAMDPNGEGQISRDAFRKALMALGLISRPRDDKSPTRRGSMDDGLSSPSGRSSRRGRSKSPVSPRVRDYEREIDELFATFDVSGTGSLDYEELHRLLRVGQNSRMSEYLRAAVAGKSLPPQVVPFSGSYHGPPIAKHKATPSRSRDPGDRSGPGIALPIDSMPEIQEAEWPGHLRALLLRERDRVIDLFRHWEGVGEGGRISAEHFKAGLYVLGHRVSRSDVAVLYAAMGVAEGEALRFAELRRQLRVVAHRGESAYLRAATKQGLELESTQPRGSLMSGVADKIDQTPLATPHENILAALGLANSTRKSFSAPSPGSGDTPVPGHGDSQRGGLMGGMMLSSHYSEGVVGLGADAASGKERALIAAADAGAQAAQKSASLLASEMWIQQWARGHYSALLPELRRWEVYPEGMITFDVFADSLHTLGFPAGGRWQEVENVFYSWEPDDRGRLHWQTVRSHMTGGRLVRVQQAKHNTVAYYKQASRAGEGFGNRSGARFRYETNSFVGPGKYTPDASGKYKEKGYAGGGHSGKLKSTGPRFLKTQTSDAPGPGKYTPRHTLIDARTEIPDAHHH